MKSDELQRSPVRQPWCEMQQDKITEIWHTLYGNGQPGLRQEMTQLKAQLSTAVALMRWIIGLLLVIGLPVIGWFLSRVLPIITLIFTK